MERLTCYESILYQLLVFNYATKKSLLLLNFSKDAIYRAVERGLEERTISDGRMTYNIKGVSRKHQLTYLTITPIGIEYLKQKCSHKIQWLSNLSVEDSERVQIKGTRFSTNYAERFLRSTVSMQMAVEAGVSGKMILDHDSRQKSEDKMPYLSGRLRCGFRPGRLVVEGSRRRLLCVLLPWHCPAHSV